MDGNRQVRSEAQLAREYAVAVPVAKGSAYIPTVHELSSDCPCNPRIEQVPAAVAGSGGVAEVEALTIPKSSPLVGYRKLIITVLLMSGTVAAGATQVAPQWAVQLAVASGIAYQLANVVQKFIKVGN